MAPPAAASAREWTSHFLTLKRQLREDVAHLVEESELHTLLEKYRLMSPAERNEEAEADYAQLRSKENQVRTQWKRENRCACTATLNPDELPTCTHIRPALEEAGKEVRIRAIARTILGLETTALRTSVANPLKHA